MKDYEYIFVTIERLVEFRYRSAATRWYLFCGAMFDIAVYRIP